MFDVLTEGVEKIGLNTEYKVDLDDVTGLNQLVLPVLLVLCLRGCAKRSSGAVQVVQMADYLHHVVDLGKKVSKNT